jgi:tetraacyldisaccharide 4'-kinase
MIWVENTLAQGQYHPIPWWQQAISGVYGWGAAAHRMLYRAKVLHTVILPVPVISVGNLTAGGTGKTPVTIALARHLCQQGKAVLVLSRGYRAQQTFVPGHPLTPAHGDEPFCIQQAVPHATVWVGHNRVALAKQALAITHQPDVIVLDDGHQHFRLHKMLDWVLVDAQRGVGNGHCLPFGPLRHPLSAEPPRHLIWVHKGQPATPPDLWPQHAAGYHAEHVTLTTQLAMANQPDTPPPPGRVVVMTGVAHPTPLLDWLNQQGYPVVTHLPYPDHAAFTAADWHQAVHVAGQHNALLVVTHKDWVKASPALQAELAAHTAVADLVACLPFTLINQVNALFFDPR